VAGAINDPEFYNSPLTSLVCVENTTNKGGGACYEIEDLQKKFASLITKFHMDGARMECLSSQKTGSKIVRLYLILYLSVFLKVSGPSRFCFTSYKATIARALRVRKILGGCDRWLFAAAGIML
jgi:threonine aldolase